MHGKGVFHLVEALIYLNRSALWGNGITPDQRGKENIARYPGQIRTVYISDAEDVLTSSRFGRSVAIAQSFRPVQQIAATVPPISTGTCQTNTRQTCLIFLLWRMPSAETNKRKKMKFTNGRQKDDERAQDDGRYAPVVERVRGAAVAAERTVNVFDDRPNYFGRLGFRPGHVLLLGQGSTYRRQ